MSKDSVLLFLLVSVPSDLSIGPSTCGEKRLRLKADLIGRLLSHDPNDRLQVQDVTWWNDRVFQRSVVSCCKDYCYWGHRYICV